MIYIYNYIYEKMLVYMCFLYIYIQVINIVAKLIHTDTNTNQEQEMNFANKIQSKTLQPYAMWNLQSMFSHCTIIPIEIIS